MQLADAGAVAAAERELAVDALDLEGAARQEGLEELLDLELEVDGAARGELGRGVGLEVSVQGGGRRYEGEQAPEAVEEESVVADEVDDGQAFFAVVAAQAAAELLEEDDAGLGGAEHDDAVDRGDVDALVEHVDDAQGV